MKYCRNCGHRVFDHINFTNAETSEIVGMVCCGTDSKNEGHTMVADAGRGTMSLRPQCQCRELEIFKRQDDDIPDTANERLDKWMN